MRCFHSCRLVRHPKPRREPRIVAHLSFCRSTHQVMFDRVRYLLSVGEFAQLPPDRGAEVAFAGRSNAGKSSALNALCGRRGIAFVSKTPGRTQLINFFQVAPGRCLVDLPGHGYANAPAALRVRWEALIGTYLRQRRALRGL